MFHVVTHAERNGPARRKTVSKENILQDLNLVLIKPGQNFFEEGLETTFQQLQFLSSLEKYEADSGQKEVTVTDVLAKNVYCNSNTAFVSDCDSSVAVRGDFVLKYKQLPCPHQPHYYIAGNEFKVIKGLKIVKVCRCNTSHDDEGFLNTPTTCFAHKSDSDIKRLFSFLSSASTPIFDALHDLKLLYTHRLRVYLYGLYWEPEYTQKGNDIAIVKRDENIFLRPVDSNKKLILCLFCKNVIKKCKNSFANHKSHLKQHNHMANDLEFGAQDTYQNNECTSVLRIASRNGLVGYFSHHFGYTQDPLQNRRFVKNMMENIILLYQQTMDAAVSNVFTESFSKNKDLIPEHLFQNYEVVKDLLSQRGVSISACSDNWKFSKFPSSTFNTIIFRTNFYCEYDEKLQIYDGRFCPSYTNNFLGIRSFVELPDGKAIHAFNNFEASMKEVKKNMASITTDRGTIRSARQKYCSENGLGSITCGIHIINCCIQLLTSKYFFNKRNIEDTIVESVIEGRNESVNLVMFDFSEQRECEDRAVWDNDDHGLRDALENFDEDIEIPESLESDIEPVGEVKMSHININSMSSNDNNDPVTYTLDDLDAVNFETFKPLLQLIIKKIKTFQISSPSLTEESVSNILIKADSLHSYYSRVPAEKHGAFGFVGTPHSLYQIKWESAANIFFMILKNKNSLLEFANTVKANDFPATDLEFSNFDFLIYELFFLIFRLFQSTVKILGTSDTTMFYYQYLIMNYVRCQQLFCYELADIGALSLNTVESFLNSMSNSISDCARTLEANLADQLRYQYIKHHIETYGLESYKRCIADKLILYLSCHFSDINFLDADSELTSTLIKNDDGSQKYKYPANASTAQKERLMPADDLNATPRTYYLPNKSSQNTVGYNLISRSVLNQDFILTGENSGFFFVNSDSSWNSEIENRYTRAIDELNYESSRFVGDRPSSNTSMSLINGIISEVTVMVEKIQGWEAIFYNRHGNFDESNTHNKIRLNSYLYSQYQRAFPNTILTVVLKDLFSFFPSSVEAERIFSATRFCKQEDSTKMTSRNFTNIITCKHIAKTLKQNDRAKESSWDEIKTYVKDNFSYRERQKPRPVSVQSMYS